MSLRIGSDTEAYMDFTGEHVLVTMVSICIRNISLIQYSKSVINYVNQVCFGFCVLRFALFSVRPHDSSNLQIWTPVTMK